MRWSIVSVTKRANLCKIQIMTLHRKNKLRGARNGGFLLYIRNIFCHEFCHKI